MGIRYKLADMLFGLSFSWCQKCDEEIKKEIIVTKNAKWYLMKGIAHYILLKSQTIIAP